MADPFYPSRSRGSDADINQLIRSPGTLTLDRAESLRQAGFRLYPIEKSLETREES